MTRRARRPARSHGPRLLPPLPGDPAAIDDRLSEIAGADHWTGSSMRTLAARVGGVEALRTLDAEPLRTAWPDPEAFDEPMRSTIRAICQAFDAQPPWMLDDERRAILSRLVMSLSAQPDVLCAGDPARTAAALVWLVERSLDRGRRPDVGWVWSMYRVPQSAQRAHTLYRALGFATTEDGVRRRDLPDPQLIPARGRQQIIDHRDRLIDEYERHRRAVEAAKPIRHLGNGQVAARGRVIRPLWAAQGSVDGVGRRMVLLAVDHVHDLDGPARDPSRSIDDVDEVMSMSIPDAWALLQHLQRALAFPATAP